jgi:branched-chain amino acid transport system substrate-binding protein
MQIRRRAFAIGGCAYLIGSSANSFAQTKSAADKIYDPGASDTEIRLGHFCPYSGPASAYKVIGEAHAAYWKWINDNGGINGRKVVFLSRDDGYDPKRSLEVTRQLVENDKVLCLYNPLGTENNTAIRGYMNEQKIPQLWVSTGAAKWGNPTQFPWTIGFQPDYRFEAAAYVKHALRAKPNAKFGLLIQNDEFGEDYLRGVRDVLPDHANRLAVATYDVNADRLDTQIDKLKASGADALINVTVPKFAVDAIRRVAELKWKPVHYITNVSLSDASVMRPAGVENTIGIITAAYLKDPANKVWENDAEMKIWRGWMAKYLPSADKTDVFYVFAYAVSSLMRETLRRCGNNLTRENLMRQATTLSYVRIPLLLPNIYVRTAPNDYYPISDVQLSQFTGAVWRPLQGYMRNPRTFAEPTNDVAQSDRRDVPAATQAADAPAAATDTKLPAPPTTASVPATPASK